MRLHTFIKVKPLESNVIPQKLPLITNEGRESIPRKEPMNKASVHKYSYLTTELIGDQFTFSIYFDLPFKGCRFV